MAQLNFPDPNSVQVYEAGGLKWTWNTTHQVWSAEISGDAAPGGGIEEAPTDGKQYGRQNEDWTEITGGSVDLSNYVTLDGTETIIGQKTFSQAVIADISGNAATADSATNATNATTATTATNATNATNTDKIKRNGKVKTDTASYRLLLGPNSNTAGYGDCYVITDRTSCYYTPSTDKLTVGTINADLVAGKVGSAYKTIAWNAVGMICMTSSSYQALLAPGANQSGATIIPACADGSKYGSSGLPGTWRCQGMQVANSGTFKENQTTNHIRTA